MDVLKIINDLKASLWAKYGNVLLREFSQEEIHFTYYAGDLLARNGHEYRVINDLTLYTEKAMQMAFVAGLRIGNRDAEEMANQIVSERISAAIDVLQTGEF